MKTTTNKTIQEGLLRGVQAVAKAKADPQAWLLRSRLAFIADKLAEQHPGVERLASRGWAEPS